MGVFRVFDRSINLLFLSFFFITSSWRGPLAKLALGRCPHYYYSKIKKIFKVLIWQIAIRINKPSSVQKWQRGESFVACFSCLNGGVPLGLWACDYSPIDSLKFSLHVAWLHSQAISNYFHGGSLSQPQKWIGTSSQVKTVSICCLVQISRFRHNKTLHVTCSCWHLILFQRAKYLSQKLLLNHTQKINRNTREIRINETWIL